MKLVVDSPLCRIMESKAFKTGKPDPSKFLILITNLSIARPLLQTKTICMPFTTFYYTTYQIVL